MSYIVMGLYSCGDVHVQVMAYIVMAYIVMAYMIMAYMVMHYIVMAYIAIAYVVMAYVVMAPRCHCSLPSGGSGRTQGREGGP